MANWWVAEGINWLSGVEGDVANPPRLPDAEIIQFLMQYPQARLDYNLQIVLMPADEQARLATMIAANPMVGSVFYDVWDNHMASDKFQSIQNTVGIHPQPLGRQN